ncbi:SRPBCC domain-containing protein [Sphingobacterium anhuiense]|uniref:SRPBCC domain-containing protein n=1 Tax=Sphingobacterium anhuiense TaxID=493780 RepID=UPI003C303EF8
MKTSISFIITLVLLSFNSKSTTVNKTLKIQEMENNNYTSTFKVDKDASTTFEAIKNFRAWWSEEIEGNTEKLGEAFLYHYKDIHLCKLKLVEEIPNVKLVYLVTDNEFNFIKDKTEWVNTKLIFDLSKDGEQTKVTFTHEGLTPLDECFEICNDSWANYIQGSLKNLIETGRGNPNAKEGGLNAELVEKWGLPNK